MARLRTTRYIIMGVMELYIFGERRTWGGSTCCGVFSFGQIFSTRDVRGEEAAVVAFFSIDEMIATHWLISEKSSQDQVYAHHAKFSRPQIFTPILRFRI